MSSDRPVAQTGTAGVDELQPGQCLIDAGNSTFTDDVEISHFMMTLSQFANALSSKRRRMVPIAIFPIRQICAILRGSRPHSAG